MLYPIFFYPIYKTTLWGGDKIKSKFNRKTPMAKIAESWEISCHKSDVSLVSNGKLKGKSLKELFISYRKEIFGSKAESLNEFPLLIKFIDANKPLSVQVHPNDEYALKNENDLGKTEMWYIIDAEDNAQIVYGLNSGVDKVTIKESISNNTIEKCLNYISVKKGDFVYIPSGTVHCLLGGTLIAEIQQNSDTTYRLYDWNRTDSNGKARQLHVEKSLEVINFRECLPNNSVSAKRFNGYSIAELVDSQFFKVQEIKITGSYRDNALGDSFITFTNIEGSGRICGNGYCYVITPGTSFLIPAGLGQFVMEGKLTLLKAFI